MFGLGFRIEGLGFRVEAFQVWFRVFFQVWFRVFGFGSGFSARVLGDLAAL